MTTALDGVRVLDLSRHLAGPFAAMTLGDLGADVIKIERPGTGDDTRDYPPFWNGSSCYFMSANRNKRSVTLDMSAPDGQEVLRRLVAESDVLIHNFKLGTMEKWGLGFEQLHELNRRLIYCEISAVGRTGPDKSRTGVDLLMQAYGGLMSITGVEGDAPVRVGTSVVDLTAGANAVQAILAALLSRERTGEGQLVESSLLEGQVAWLSYHAVSYFATGEVPKRRGAAHGSLAPYSAYRTQDGHVVIAVATESSWQRFCGVIGRSDLISDERFVTNSSRCLNQVDLDTLIGNALKSAPSASWVARMEAVGVPCSSVNDVGTVLSLPQLAEREMIVDIPRADIPDLRVPGVAIKLHGTPGSVRLPPPGLGEHSEEILMELGLQSDDIDRLRSSGAV